MNSIDLNSLMKWYLIRKRSDALLENWPIISELGSRHLSSDVLINEYRYTYQILSGSALEPCGSDVPFYVDSICINSDNPRSPFVRLTHADNSHDGNGMLIRQFQFGWFTILKRLIYPGSVIYFNPDSHRILIPDESFIAYPWRSIFPAEANTNPCLKGHDHVRLSLDSVSVELIDDQGSFQYLFIASFRNLDGSGLNYKKLYFHYLEDFFRLNIFVDDIVTARIQNEFVEIIIVDRNLRSYHGVPENDCNPAIPILVRSQSLDPNVGTSKEVLAYLKQQNSAASRTKMHHVVKTISAKDTHRQADPNVTLSASETQKNTSSPAPITIDAALNDFIEGFRLSSRRIPSSIRLRWNERILALKITELGEMGAVKYLSKYGRGISSSKVISFALLADQEGYHDLALGFWKAAYQINNHALVITPPHAINKIVSGHPSSSGKTVDPASPSIMPRIDWGKVEALEVETQQAQSILSSHFYQLAHKTPPPSVNIPAVPPPSTVSEDPQLRIGGLDERLAAVVSSFGGKHQLDAAEFRNICHSVGIMPKAAIESINAWSDEKHGEFLIHGDGPFFINHTLLLS